MMHGECKGFSLHERPNWEINDLFVSCGRDENWDESSVSYDLINLLPVDPFGMNLETTFLEMDLGTKISASFAEWIETSSDDYEANCDAYNADLTYYWSEAVLSSFETQLNPGFYVVDFGIKNFPGSGFDISEDESFRSVVDVEQVLVNEQSTDIHPCEDGNNMTSSFEGSIGAINYDYEVNSDALFTGSSYYWSEGVLSSVDTQLNPGSNVADFCNKGFFGSGTDAYEDESFGAVWVAEPAMVAGKSNDIHPCVDESSVHEGLILSLVYLGVQDLLSVERVCRAFRMAVKSDPLLWRCIHLDYPLGDKITDVDLYQLTQRAQGSLQCLSLLRCPRITNDGLKRVLESNLRLKKLSVPGCLRLTLKGLINSIKAFKLSGGGGIKTLKLGRLFIASLEQFEELKSLVGADELHQTRAQKLRFYHESVSSLACDDDCTIDIEACPRCQRCRLVFDCPLESCQCLGPENCRACNACIPRCTGCGKCINNCEYMETFCLECICFDCWKTCSLRASILEGHMEAAS